MAEGRTVACKRCGTHVEPALVCISPRAELVCPTCDATERIAFHTAEGRRTVFHTALGGLTAGLVPCVFASMTLNHSGTSGTLIFYKPLIFVAGVAAVALAITTLRRCRATEERRALGRLFGWTVVAAAMAAILGSTAIVAVGSIYAGLAVLGAFLLWPVFRKLAKRP